jgi:hypothetical protein
VAEIHVHEFMSLDGVIDAPTWTFDYGFLPQRSGHAQRWLVDQLHLFVYPVTRGSGPRMLPEHAAPSALSLATCESYENGVIYVSYRPKI